jgi:hypothetical protein
MRPRNRRWLGASGGDRDVEIVDARTAGRYQHVAAAAASRVHRWCALAAGSPKHAAHQGLPSPSRRRDAPRPGAGLCLAFGPAMSVISTSNIAAITASPAAVPLPLWVFLWITRDVTRGSAEVGDRHLTLHEYWDILRRRCTLIFNFAICRA